MFDIKLSLCYNNYTKTTDRYVVYKWSGCKFAADQYAGYKWLGRIVAPLTAEGFFRSKLWKSMDFILLKIVF